MLSAFTAATLIAVAYPASRQFVYAYTIDTASGTGPRDGAKDDTGTIRVEVLHLQNDTGLVVSVSEQSQARHTKPAMCVTYGTGLVQCSPIENVTIEEMSLLRLLGRNFVNWAEIDRNRTWHNGASDGRAQETNEFRITGQRDKMLDIAFDRVLHVAGPDGYVSTTKGRLSYNAGSSAPTSVTQETIMQAQGSGESQVVEDLTLTLQSDSVATR